METIQLIDRATARKAIFMAKTLEHQDRQRILAHLLAAGGAGCTVTNIYTADAFRNRPADQGGEMEQSECSQHLSWLRRHGYVTTERQGKHIIYTANTAIIMAAEVAMTALAALMPTAEAA